LDFGQFEERNAEEIEKEKVGRKKTKQRENCSSPICFRSFPLRNASA